VTAAIGVLCARVRVEEKQLLAALAEAGVPASPLAPAACPYPLAPAPSPSGPVALDGSTGRTTGATLDGARCAEVVIDRLADRRLAAALLPVWQAQGKAVLGAGLAAGGNRAAVAATLAAAGLPRPLSFLATSEDAAIIALAQTGYPATLLPVDGAAAIVLWDNDSAEAILEHRSVLGGVTESVVLVQAGAPSAAERMLVHVVGGQAVATEDPGNLAGTSAVLELAEAAADALGAAIAGIEIALTPVGFVVWDVQPVADFRNAAPLGTSTVAAAVASLAAGRLAARPAFKRSIRVHACPDPERRDGERSHARTGGVHDPVAEEDAAEVAAAERWRGEEEVGHDAVLTA
jgi:[lysine-biosynthesis-protein LysW]--L-2-aminoadipate ligase